VLKRKCTSIRLESVT